MRHQYILDLIDRMGKTEHLASYAETLRGPRTRGSVTAKGLEALPPEAEWTEVHSPKVVLPECKYYQCHLGGLIGAQVGALPLREALEKGFAVKMREGRHGPELYVDRELPELPTTELLTVVLGPDEDGVLPEIVWTWHPGAPLATLKAGLCEWTAVKLHRG